MEKTITKFSDYKPRLIVEEDFVQATNEWNIIIDISTTWNEFKSKMMSLNDFNVSYVSSIIGHQSDIQRFMGEEGWIAIKDTLNDLTPNIGLDASMKIYNHLYDMFDKASILIKINEEKSEKNT